MMTLLSFAFILIVFFGYFVSSILSGDNDAGGRSRQRASSLSAAAAQSHHLGAGKSVWNYQHQNQLNNALSRNANDWCSYVRSTEEPKLLIYNRIPKCGSSTMQKMVRRQVDKLKSMKYYSANSGFWIDLSQNAAVLDKLYADIYDALRGTPDLHLFSKDNWLGAANEEMLLVEGHFWGHSFDPSRLADKQIGDVSIEYIQLTRECESRAKSHLIYDLFEGAASQAYRTPRGVFLGDLIHPNVVIEKVKNRYFKDRSEFSNKDWVIKQAGPNRTIEECLGIPECFKEIPKVKYNRYADGFMAKFMHTDAEYIANNKSALAAATATVFRPRNSKLLVFGIVEKFAQFFEMLECVYPTAFQGAAAHFHANPLHSRGSPKIDTTSSIKNFTSASCAHIDGILYKRMKQVFEHRYSLMKSSNGRCCRKRRDG